MLSTQQKPSWGTPTGYAASHCTQCKAGWVRTGKEGGKLTVCLRRPGAGVGRHDGLQQVRAEESGLASRGGESGSYGAEADAISAEFARKLDGLRRRLPKWEIPAAIRALKNDRAVALQALRDKKQGERFAAREITRRAQAGFPPTARPS